MYKGDDACTAKQQGKGSAWLSAGLVQGLQTLRVAPLEVRRWHGVIAG